VRAHPVGARDEFAVVAALLEESFRVRLLEIAAADFSRRDLRGDREHRNPRAVTIEEAIDEVQIARPAASRADGEPARQMRLGTGSEGGDFLVSDVDPLDLSLAPYGVSQPIEAITHDTVDALDPCGGEDLDELLSNNLCHRCSTA
jgi:hypothetical protein